MSGYGGAAGVGELTSWLDESWADGSCLSRHLIWMGEGEGCGFAAWNLGHGRGYVTSMSAGLELWASRTAHGHAGAGMRTLRSRTAGLPPPLLSLMGSAVGMTPGSHAQLITPELSLGILRNRDQVTNIVCGVGAVYVLVQYLTYMEGYLGGCVAQTNSSSTCIIITSGN